LGYKTRTGEILQVMSPAGDPMEIKSSGITKQFFYSIGLGEVGHGPMHGILSLLGSAVHGPENGAIGHIRLQGHFYHMP
jgi:hypothetical protein